MAKLSTVDLVNVWGPDYCCSARCMKSRTLFECGPLPYYIHLMSTRCHSQSRCSNAFSVFHCSLAAMYYAECKLKNIKWGRSGNETNSFPPTAYKCAISPKWAKYCIEPVRDLSLTATQHLQCQPHLQSNSRVEKAQHWCQPITHTQALAEDWTIR